MKISDYLRLVKFSHTIFALPFALVAVVFIYRDNMSVFEPIDLIWIVLAFTGLRSFSMALNRIVDAGFDAANPRTAKREIPAGILSKLNVWIFSFIALLVVWVSAWLLNPLAFYLSFPAIALLSGYSYAKRFTWAVHLWLGLAIGLAPIGAYIALTSSLPFTAWLLYGILATYIAGFDILYSLQDREFDKKAGLYSIPATLGINAAIWISKILHAITIAGFWTLWKTAEMGWVYGAGSLVLTALVIAEHVSIGWGKNVKLNNVPAAFINYNSAISILFFGFVLADYLWTMFG